MALNFVPDISFKLSLSLNAFLVFYSSKPQSQEITDDLFVSRNCPLKEIQISRLQYTGDVLSIKLAP